MNESVQRGLKLLNPGSVVPVDVKTVADLYNALDYTVKQAEKREWVGLTQKELDDLWDEHHDAYGYQLSADGYERAIEAKLKERNHG